MKVTSDFTTKSGVFITMKHRLGCLDSTRGDRFLHGCPGLPRQVPATGAAQRSGAVEFWSLFFLPLFGERLCAILIKHISRHDWHNTQHITTHDTWIYLVYIYIYIYIYTGNTSCTVHETQYIVHNTKDTIHNTKDWMHDRYKNLYNTYAYAYADTHTHTYTCWLLL